jgi:putative Mg2+ transporter-C (MgtC) family protein
MVVLGTPDYVARLGAAFVLGAIIGLERERQPRPAGLRTHTLVALAAALLILVSTYGFADAAGQDGVVLDPSRVAAQVVSGIGFVGAGAIIAQPNRVRGLTTASSLWMAAAIGLACGAGLFVPAIIGTVLALIVLVPLKYLEDKVFHHFGVTLTDEDEVREGRH